MIESSDLLIGSVAFAPKEVKVVFESSRASKQFTEPISPWSFSKINQTLKMFVKPLHDTTHTLTYILVIGDLINTLTNEWESL